MEEDVEELHRPHDAAFIYPEHQVGPRCYGAERNGRRSGQHIEDDQRDLSRTYAEPIK